MSIYKIFMNLPRHTADFLSSTEVYGKEEDVGLESPSRAKISV